MKKPEYRYGRTLVLVVSAALLTACGRGGDGAGEDAAEAAEPTSATITSVVPIKETSETPRQVCEDVVVTEQEPIKDQHRIGGTTAGVVVGGIIGNQVGDGRGKSLATAAGAAAGGYAGNKMQEKHQDGKTTTRTESQCETVVDKSSRVVGYTVNYDLGDKSGSVRMDKPPTGNTIPVVNGQLVLQTASVPE